MIGGVHPGLAVEWGGGTRSQFGCQHRTWLSFFHRHAIRTSSPNGRKRVDVSVLLFFSPRSPALFPTSRERQKKIIRLILVIFSTTGRAQSFPPPQPRRSTLKKYVFHFTAGSHFFRFPVQYTSRRRCILLWSTWYYGNAYDLHIVIVTVSEDPDRSFQRRLFFWTFIDVNYKGDRSWYSHNK